LTILLTHFVYSSTHSVCTLQASRENEEIGVMFMERAANAGDRSAMIYLAKAYESGVGLGINRLV